MGGGIFDRTALFLDEGGVASVDHAINAKSKYEDRKRKKKSSKSRRNPRRSRNTRRKPRRSRNTRRKPRRSRNTRRKPRKSRNTRKIPKGKMDGPLVLSSTEAVTDQLPSSKQALNSREGSSYSLNQVVYPRDIEHPPAEGFPPVKPDEETRGTHKNKELLEGVVANEESGGGSENMVVEIPGFGVPGDDFSQGGTDSEWQTNYNAHGDLVIVDDRFPLGAEHPIPDRLGGPQSIAPALPPAAPALTAGGAAGGGASEKSKYKINPFTVKRPPIQKDKGKDKGKGKKCGKNEKCGNQQKIQIAKNNYRQFYRAMNIQKLDEIMSNPNTTQEIKIDQINALLTGGRAGGTSSVGKMRSIVGVNNITVDDIEEILGYRKYGSQLNKGELVQLVYGYYNGGGRFKTPEEI